MKILGAVLIIGACGGVGLTKAAAHRRFEKELENLITALEYMECELSYQLTPLPELCRKTAAMITGSIQELFHKLAQELEAQISPDVSACMSVASDKASKLSPQAMPLIVQLGQWLGRFDLSGQVKSLESITKQCKNTLKALQENRAQTLRGYQTLGFCAGAALAILFL